MLGVEVHDSANCLSLKLEGRFTGVDGREHSHAHNALPRGNETVVDLTDVTFIDPVGEEVLALFGRFGTEFVAQTSYPIHSIYASARICALLEMGHRVRTYRVLPAQTVADKGPSHVSRKTRKSENPRLTTMHVQ